MSTWRRPPRATDAHVGSRDDHDHRPRSAGPAHRDRARPVPRREPGLTGPLRRRRPPLRSGAHDVDGEVERWLPPLPRPGPRQPGGGRGRPHLCRLRARRHRGDGGAQPTGDGGGGHPADPRPRRAHRDVADRRRRVGRRGAHPSVRSDAVVLHVERHRRQPVGGPAGPPGHRADQDPHLRVLLPRVGRRDLCVAGARRGGHRPRRQRRSARPARPDDARRRVQRPGRRRARAGPRRRRRHPRRAGPHQHRHRPARARVHGRACVSWPRDTARCS